MDEEAISLVRAALRVAGEYASAGRFSNDDIIEAMIVEEVPEERQREVTSLANAFAAFADEVIRGARSDRKLVRKLGEKS